MRGANFEDNHAGKLIRIEPLDGLRGIAILAIVFGHLFIDPYERVIHHYTPCLWAMLRNFRWGVSLFFVISGFLIGGILLDNSFSKVFLKSFYIRRAIRILPLYYILVFFILGREYFFGDTLPTNITPFWSYLFFLQNFWKPQYYYHFVEAGVTWSLAIEEQFYLLAPLFLTGSTSKIIKRVVPLLIIISICCRTLCRLHLGLQFQAYGHLITLQYLEPGFLSTIDVIAIGVWGAFILRIKRFQAILTTRFSRYCAVPIVGAILTLASISIQMREPFWIVVFGPDILGFLFVGLILIIVLNKKIFINQLLSTRLLTIPGKYCYFIYLFHQVMFANANLFFEGTVFYNGFIVRCIAVSITFASSIISWRFLEYPMSNQARKKWNYPQSQENL